MGKQAIAFVTDYMRTLFRLRIGREASPAAAAVLPQNICAATLPSLTD